MGQRKIVFFGNCQALALQRFCQRFLAPRVGDVTTAIDIAAYDVAKARVELSNADLIVEQVFDQKLEIDVAAEYAADKVVRFPNVYAIFYWPYTNQRHPRNDEIGKGYDEGPYPNELGDSFLNRLILENVPADKALEIYLREDLSARADRLLELNAEMQRKRDAAACLDVQSHIAQHFRDDHLFRTSAHPNMRIFSLVAEGVFIRVGYAKGMIENALAAQRVSPYPRVALPIHPGVIRHFGLRFASAKTRYPYFDEGDYTFAEYVRRYMNFEWNAALRDAFRLAARDPDLALAQIEDACRHSPRSAAAARVRSDLLVQKRDYPAAATAAQLATTLDADDMRNWLALSRAHRLAGALDLAEDALRRAAGVAPVDAEVRTEAAHLSGSRGQWQTAAEEARRAVDIEPGTARFHASLSEFLAQSGAADKAIAAASRAVEMDPGFPGYRLALADQLDRAGRAAEAAAILRDLIAEGGGDADAHVRLGQVLARAGDLDGAVAAFRQAVELAPDNVGLRLALADILDRKDESAEAAAILGALVFAGSRDPHHHARLGHFLDRAGDLAGAEAALRRAIELAPEDAGFRRGLIGFLDRNGRFDEALAAVRALIAGGLRDRHTLGRLGNLLARRGDVAGAEQAYREAIETAPDEAGLQFALADLLEHDGRAGEAVEILRLATTRNEHDRDAHRRLAELLKRTDDAAGAEEAFRRARGESR